MRFAILFALSVVSIGLAFRYDSTVLLYLGAGSLILACIAFAFLIAKDEMARQDAAAQRRKRTHSGPVDHFEDVVDDMHVTRLFQAETPAAEPVEISDETRARVYAHMSQSIYGNH